MRRPQVLKNSKVDEAGCNIASASYLTFKVVAVVIMILCFILGYHAIFISSAERYSSLPLFLIITIATSITTYLLVYPYVDDYLKLSRYLLSLNSTQNPVVPNLSGVVHNLSANLWQANERRRRTQLELEEQILNSTPLFNAIPTIVLILDNDMKIQRANHFAHITFGEGIEGADIINIVNNHDIKAGVLKVLATGERCALSITTDTDPVYFYDASIEYYGIQGSGYQRVIIVMHDISEIKRTDIMLTDFIANASHEVRTPLTAIVGAIDMLEFSGWEMEAAQEFMPILKGQTYRMCSLVNQLITLLNVERTQHGYEFVELYIPDLMPFVLRQLEGIIAMYGVTMIVNYEDNLVPTYGHPWELEHALYQIISNAILHGGPGKQVMLSVGVTEIKGTDMIYISVKDQGEGIRAEHVARITERFYRTDSSRSRKIGGSGLGLSIVKQIVAKHKGILEVESDSERGSIFTIYLPISGRV